MFINNTTVSIPLYCHNLNFSFIIMKKCKFFYTNGLLFQCSFFYSFSTKIMKRPAFELSFGRFLKKSSKRFPSQCHKLLVLIYQYQYYYIIIKCFSTERFFKNQVFTLYVIQAHCRDWYILKPVFWGDNSLYHSFFLHQSTF